MGVAVVVAAAAAALLVGPVVVAEDEEERHVEDDADDGDDHHEEAVDGDGIALEPACRGREVDRVGTGPVTWRKQRGELGYTHMHAYRQHKTH